MITTCKVYSHTLVTLNTNLSAHKQISCKYSTFISMFLLMNFMKRLCMKNSENAVPCKKDSQTTGFCVDSIAF